MTILAVRTYGLGDDMTTEQVDGRVIEVVDVRPHRNSIKVVEELCGEKQGGGKVCDRHPDDCQYHGDNE
jgi:hypothetical protein